MINKNILKYLKENKNYTREVLIKALKDGGYSDEDIQAAEQEMNKKSWISIKKLLPPRPIRIFAILGAGLIGIGLIIFFTFNWKDIPVFGTSVLLRSPQPEELPLFVATGTSMLLDYSISTIDLEKISHSNERFKENDHVFVTLQKNEKEEWWEAKKISLAKPSESPVIEGRIDYMAGQILNVVYGIEEYFIDPKFANEASRLFSVDLSKGDIAVEVRVVIFSDGRAKVDEVFLGGIALSDLLRDRTKVGDIRFEDPKNNPGRLHSNILKVSDGLYSYLNDNQNYPSFSGSSHSENGQNLLQLLEDPKYAVGEALSLKNNKSFVYITNPKPLGSCGSEEPSPYIIGVLFPEKSSFLEEDNDCSYEGFSCEDPIYCEAGLSYGSEESDIFDREVPPDTECSEEYDNNCPSWCVAGTDYDCCTAAGKSWISGQGCY